jgi:hypothetical protein
MSIEYTAVGVDHAETCVVIALKGPIGYTTIELNEKACRKMADDMLRNANYLWPIEEEKK